MSISRFVAWFPSFHRPQYHISGHGFCNVTGWGATYWKISSNKDNMFCMSAESDGTSLFHLMFLSIFRFVLRIHWSAGMNHYRQHAKRNVLRGLCVDSHLASHLEGLVSWRASFSPRPFLCLSSHDEGTCFMDAHSPPRHIVSNQSAPQTASSDFNGLIEKLFVVDQTLRLGNRENSFLSFFLDKQTKW